jgi:hypothetical protein
VRVEPSSVHVESGGVGAAGPFTLALRKALVRAVVPGSRGSAAQMDFTYRGPSQDVAPLASGELRRQIGFKLRSQDTCNVITVMWHVAPTTGLHVQVKSNPGQRTHQECRDRGYRRVDAIRRSEVPPIRIGARRSLAAFIQGNELHVLADGRLVWEGALPSEAFAFDGPAGIRSDNGEFDVDLWATLRPDASGSR